MRKIMLTLVFMVAPAAMANTELNTPDVVADQSAKVQAPDPSAKSVVIQFDKNGKPVAVAHSDKEKVNVKDLDKLAFAQVVASAEEPNNLASSTPANEKQVTQGTPQWGFWGGRGYGGYGYRGGYIGWRGGYGGYGYGGYGGYGYGGYGGYGYAGYGGYGGYGYGWSGCGGGCGYYPTYYYSGCAYAPVAYYGAYAVYQPSYYY